MGNFRSNSRGGFGGGFGGSRFDRRSRDRDSERFERRPQNMYEATCAKCGKRCQVPFRPTGSKPVFCDDCFRQNGDSRNKDSQSLMSSDQFHQINAKLDKILLVLQSLELDTEGEELSDSLDSEDEFEDDENEKENADEEKEDQ